MEEIKLPSLRSVQCKDVVLNEKLDKPQHDFTEGELC